MDTKYLDLTFKENKLDAIVTSSPQTRLWYSGVESSDGWIVIEKDKAYLFVDSRYIEYARAKARNVEVLLLSETPLKHFLADKNYKTIGIEGDYEVFNSVKNIETMSPNSKIVSISAQKLRLIKTPEEIAKLQKAIDISLAAYDDLVKTIQPGQTEREIDHKLNYLMKQKGSGKECFSSIVAAAHNSSKPHHHPTDETVKQGELLKIDFGATYEGFGADITRTFIVGGKANNPEAEKIYQIVEEAARRGRQAVKPGVTTGEIDKVCRDYIQAQGYGDKFLHSTGHGLGIDVHELPNVSYNNPAVLEPGMVITVEPGIYIEGLGGVRIEDDVLVTETGSITLSRKNEVNGIQQ
ncbi:aminopeptidase P family protein [Candidatus Mycoplasma pogonae]